MGDPLEPWEPGTVRRRVRAVEVSELRALVSADAPFGTGEPSTADLEHGLGVPIHGAHLPRPAARAYDDAGPGWLAVAGTVAVGMLLFVALFSGILPAPLLGIALLVAARSIFARFD
jgi:hypothetical protein